MTTSLGKLKKEVTGKGSKLLARFSRGGKDEKVKIALMIYRDKCNALLATYGITDEKIATEATVEIWKRYVAYFELMKDNRLDDAGEERAFSDMGNVLKQRGIATHEDQEEILMRFMDYYCEIDV